MIADEKAIGIIVIYRTVVRPFSDKQIALVENFAKQAVIAIENARLLNELRQSLEQQTATSDVLKVISRSAFDLQAVLETLVRAAARLCTADKTVINQLEGTVFRTVANFGFPPELVQWSDRNRLPGDRASATGRAALEGRPIHIPDVLADPEYRASSHQHAASYRTALAVPLLREGTTIGVFALLRDQVNPFTEQQIALAQSFGDQAVIAIENARLLNELSQRTDDLSQRTTDLTEALEQQTATSEVLRVISSSSGDLEPAFATMLENAVRICEANFGNIYRWRDDALHLVAVHNTPHAFAEARRHSPIRPPQNPPVERMIATKTPIHSTNLTNRPSYIDRSDPGMVMAVELGGVRTALHVPMFKENELVGSFALYRQEPRSFSDKQIELVKNFAAQAVIAIENASLLSELRERTAQLASQSQELAKLNEQLEQRVTDQVDEIERMGRLCRFLPPQVADLIVASGSEKQLESHRREITALFCDLRGFTGFTESADAEDVMALLREYHAAIGEKIVRYSGTLERYAGDSVMVVFNDPVPVENPALQAVLMALEMRDAIGALTGKWRRFGHDIGFGIGIAHGFATLGTIGFQGTLRLRRHRNGLERRLTALRRGQAGTNPYQPACAGRG
jgi:GAF domain-containing protein